MAEEEVEMPQVMDDPNPQPLPPFEPGKFYGGQMDNMPVEQERPTLPFTPGQYQGLDRPLPMPPQAIPLPQPGPRTLNRNAAQVELNMTPQERALYDRHLNNLWGPGGVDNLPSPEEPTGSRSTLWQSTDQHNGKFYTLPNVYDGRKVDTETSLQKADEQGWDTFPSYPSEAEAEARYGQLHDYMDRDVGQYFQQNPRPSLGPPPPINDPTDFDPTQLPPYGGKGEEDFNGRFKGDGSDELGGRPGVSEQDFESFVRELMQRGRPTPEPIYDDQPIDKPNIPPMGEIDPRMIERSPTGPSSGPVVDPMELLQQYMKQREQPDAAQAMIDDVLNRRV